MSEPRDLSLTLAAARQLANPRRESQTAVDAIVRLLIAKGVITNADWLEAQRLGLNEEVAREQDRAARRGSQSP